MCFGSKNKLYDNDELPRPVPGHAPQQPTYADPAPKASMPASYSQPPQQPVSPLYSPQPLSPVYQPPTMAPPGHQQQQQQQQYLPPPGPPPVELSAVSQTSPPVELSAAEISPPPGPPPNRGGGGGGGGDDFLPPPGPPPAKRNGGDDDLSYMAPPPGPPPASSKPKHDWESLVPDTSLFPPPPSFFSGFDRSPASNATEAEAEAGERWCAQFPLAPPLGLDAAALGALRAHDVRLMTPTVGWKGSLAWRAPGVWEGRTDRAATDSTVIAYPPLYAVQQHEPGRSAAGARTVYYEVAVLQDGGKGDVCLALGFTALPYPSFRMPGWHRGSLAVHGDDGHRFVNDRWGGKAFTEPFRRGETYGIGMTFRAAGQGRIATEVFFTRQGRLTGSWDLHEESDAEQDLPVTGLEGYHDLSCAIGTYKAVSFDAIFDPARWLYQPPV